MNVQSVQQSRLISIWLRRVFGWCPFLVISNSILTQSGYPTNPRMA